MGKKAVKIIELIIINTITALRLIGSFMLPFIYHKYGASNTALIIIILFSTDLIDGYLARTLRCSTFFGSIMDASCDKLLNFTSFIILGLECNLMFAPLIIEICILYTIYSTYRYGGNVQSSITGKIKTFIVDICVIISFMILGLPVLKIKSSFLNYLISNTSNYLYIFAIIILISCLIALGDYIKKNTEARKNPKCMEIKYKNKKKKEFKLILKQLFETSYYHKHKDESIIKQFYI